MKKIVAILLALTLLTAMAPAALAADASARTETTYYMPFKDVRLDKWYFGSVLASYQMGLIDGMTEDTFDPEGYMSCAQAVKLAACLHQRYYQGSVSFTEGEPWYQVYLDYCVTNKILSYDGTQFEPGAATFDSWAGNGVTREFYALLFSRSLPDEALPVINNIPDNSIPDVKSNNYFGIGIYKLYRAGITEGVDDYGSFKPGLCITRGEVSATLLRMMDASYRVGPPALIGKR